MTATNAYISHGDQVVMRRTPIVLLILFSFMSVMGGSAFGQVDEDSGDYEEISIVDLEEEVYTTEPDLDSIDLILDSIYSSESLFPEPYPARYDTLTYDSTKVELRSLSEGDLDRYYEDSEFDYARSVRRGKSILDRFLDSIKEFLGLILGTGPTMRILLYAILAVAIILVIYFALRTRFDGVFSRKAIGKEGIVFDEVEENIHGVDFNSMIATAVAEKNWRRAVRLQYLQLLQTLSERQLITWRKEKTNREYLFELESGNVRDAFAKLTRVYDYVWYGEFLIKEEEYNRVREQFTTFTKIVT